MAKATKGSKAAPGKKTAEAGCAFCGTLAGPELVLFRGEKASICVACVELVRDILDSSSPDETHGRPPPELECGYCGRKGAEVDRLIGGVMAYLCGGCAVRVVEELANREKKAPAG